MTSPARRGFRRLPWALLAIPGAAGVPAGILWWLLAPGGMNLLSRDPALGDGANPDVWLLRDLTLAGLLVFAGCLLAVFLTDRKQPEPQAALLMGLVGGLCGAVLAWQTGIVSAQLLGPPVDASAHASVAFSLRSLSVLLVWPAATALSVFVLELMNLLGKQRDGGGVQSQHPAPRPVK